MASSPFTFSFAFTPPPSPTPTTPGAVGNYIVQVDGEIVALQDEIGAAIKSGKIHVSDDWMLQRGRFYDEWKFFATSYTGGGFLITLPSDAWDQTGQYQAKNEAWRQKFISLGGSSIGPGPQDRPAGPDLVGAVKWGAAAVIVGAVAFAAYKVLG